MFILIRYVHVANSHSDLYNHYIFDFIPIAFYVFKLYMWLKKFLHCSQSHDIQRMCSPAAVNIIIVMYDTYRNIDIFIPYRDTILAFVCINTLECRQFGKHCFSNLPNYIPKSNYNKLVCITSIHFF